MREMVQFNGKDGSLFFLDTSMIGRVTMSEEEGCWKLEFKDGEGLRTDPNPILVVRHTLAEMRTLMKVYRLETPEERQVRTSVQYEQQDPILSDVPEIPPYEGPKLYFGAKKIADKDSYLITITEDKEGNKKAVSEDLISIVEGEFRNALGHGCFEIGIREGTHYVSGWNELETAVMHFKLCGWEENDLNEVKAVVLV